MILQQIYSCTKFRQIPSSFIEDITQIFWSIFFWTHCIFNITRYCQNGMSSGTVQYGRLQSDTHGYPDVRSNFI